MGVFISKPTFSLFKKLASIRLKEARILYESKKYNGAYYLAGYAIELGIKAFYCRNVRRYSFPPEPGVVSELYKHDLNKLMNSCGLKSEFNRDVKNNGLLESSWGVVKDWGVTSRYSQTKKLDSKSMIDSVEIILKWIQTKWK